MPTRDRDETIEQARREIDSLDERLVALLERRADRAIEIGRAKRRAGVPVHDETREAEVRMRVRSLARGRLDAPGLERVFERIFELMRRLEEEDAAALTRNGDEGARR